MPAKVLLLPCRRHTAAEAVSLRTAREVRVHNARRSRRPGNLWKIVAVCLLLGLCACAQAAKFPVPRVDAGLGPCSADFTITNQNFQPLYDAQIQAHFRYGFWGTHHMSLQVATNSAGQARVTGLPENSRHPLDFVMTYGNASSDWFWTGLDCESHVKRALNVP